MVAPCCCGISLRKGCQLVATIDMILGSLGFTVLLLNTINQSKWGKKDTSSSTKQQPESREREVIYLEWMPPAFVLPSMIFHGMEFLLGIFLYAATVKKNRNMCIFWLVFTLYTVIFTGFFHRIYEMVVVFAYAVELRQEYEVTYFSGQCPQSFQITTMPQQQFTQPPSFNPNFNGVTPPAYPPNNYNPYSVQNYDNHQNHGSYNTPYYIPPALQPPPNYESVVRNEGGNTGLVHNHNIHLDGSESRASNYYPPRPPHNMYMLPSPVHPEPNMYAPTYNKF